LEESGYSSKVTDYVCTVETIYRDKGTVITVFVGELMSDKPVADRETGIKDVQFMSAKRIMNIPKFKLRFPELVQEVLERYLAGSYFPLEDFIVEISCV
jgi:hypothetical protein